MDMTQYQLEAEHTKATDFYPPKPFDKTGHIGYDILHAIIGISTESGELLDVAKKAMFYGKPIDYVNLDEEIGDVLWYIAIYCTARGTSIDKIAAQNNAKLKARFPNKFKQEQAINRDLDNERRVLESHSTQAMTYHPAAAFVKTMSGTLRQGSYVECENPNVVSFVPDGECRTVLMPKEHMYKQDGSRLFPD